jgi:hypothetical protein
MVEERYLGCDQTEGRFADVTLRRCSACRMTWLRYQVEYEAFTGSGRWAEIPLSEADAATVTPETAAALIDASPWHIYGGSYYGHAGKRGSGTMRWGP